MRNDYWVKFRIMLKEMTCFVHNFQKCFCVLGKIALPRSFAITNEGYCFQPCGPYRKYEVLRAQNLQSRRFLIGHSFVQQVGGRAISAVPKEIAKYHNLKNLEQYTGLVEHCGCCLRRTSANIWVAVGGDLITLKGFGG